MLKLPCACPWCDTDGSRRAQYSLSHMPSSSQKHAPQISKPPHSSVSVSRPHAGHGNGAAASGWRRRSTQLGNPGGGHAAAGPPASRSSAFARCVMGASGCGGDAGRLQGSAMPNTRAPSSPGEGLGRLVLLETRATTWVELQQPRTEPAAWLRHRRQYHRPHL